MKTAEEWMPALRACEVSEDWIKQIQLDAYRSGMLRAAELDPLKGFEGQYDSDAEIHAHLHGWSMLSQAILTAANNLTEKDIV